MHEQRETTSTGRRREFFEVNKDRFALGYGQYVVVNARGAYAWRGIDADRISPGSGADKRHGPRDRRRSLEAGVPNRTSSASWAASRRPPPRTTSISRSHTACATACSSAGSRRPRRTTGKRCARSAISRPSSCSGPHLGNNLVNLGAFDSGEAGHGGARSRFREAARPGRGAGPRQRRPRTARRLLPRFARDASRSRRSATASATSSGSSTSRSATAGRWRWRTSGFASAIRGRSRAPRSRSTSGSAATRSRTPTRTAAIAFAGFRARRQRHRPRHPDPRLSGQHGEPAAPVERGGGQFVRLRVVQRRRLLRRGRGEGRLRDDQQGALSERHRSPRASSSGSSSSTSSSPARCRT